jgi:hypothetical protein
MEPSRRVTLSCDCGHALDQFWPLDHRADTPFEFVLHGRTRSAATHAGRYVAETPGAPNLVLDDQPVSRSHIGKSFLHGRDDNYPEEVGEFDFAIVRYACHPRHCGRAWHVWCADVAVDCLRAARGRRPDVAVSSLPSARAAAVGQGEIVVPLKG